MNWKDKLHVKRSNAERDLTLELKKRGLTNGMEENYHVGFNFEEDQVHFTTIDKAWWLNRKYAVFLDGVAFGKKGHPKLHLTLHQSRRDERVKKALERRGWKVERYPYKPQITKKRKLEIADKIEETLNSLGYKKRVFDKPTALEE